MTARIGTALPVLPLVLFFAALLVTPAIAETTRFCLEGEFDLGARYQGTHPRAGEFYATRWCVVSDDASQRTLFSGEGQSNPDMDGGWTVAYLPPGVVRIVNRESPPDVEFLGTANAAEARSVRRLDPRRLATEYREHPERFADMKIIIEDERLRRLETAADLPLRGRVPMVWQWDWAKPDAPSARLLVDGMLVFEATGSWELLNAKRAADTWATTPGADPVEIPGDRWPARVAMELVRLADGVFLVRGVRTGFQHIVVNTSAGLVVGDAPAGWVELHQVPPADLVPGLGVSGLSERLVDFLNTEFDGRAIAAVALTHHHDDHAGGARAFAAAGAAVYAPAASAAFLEAALNRREMPPDRLARAGSHVKVIPVEETVDIGMGGNRVRLLPIGANPHVGAMLGLWAVDADLFFVSDIHVPHTDAETPPAARVLSECWFAAWAITALPDNVKIVNSHSQIATPVARLRGYLDSDACRP